MPNIEIHGLKEGPAFDLFGKICREFCVEDWAAEMVVTIHPTTVVDLRGVLQPFIRLVTTPHDHDHSIVKRLLGFGLDVEFLHLESFHPKKQSTTQ